MFDPVRRVQAGAVPPLSHQGCAQPKIPARSATLRLNVVVQLFPCCPHRCSAPGTPTLHPSPPVPTAESVLSQLTAAVTIAIGGTDTDAATRRHHYRACRPFNHRDHLPVSQSPSPPSHRTLVVMATPCMHVQAYAPFKKLKDGLYRRAYGCRMCVLSLDLTRPVLFFLIFLVRAG